MTVNRTGSSGWRRLSGVDRLPLGAVTAISLLVFLIAALLVLYVLGNPSLPGMRHLNAEYLLWKDRLLVAGAVVTLSGAVVALVVNYRKQKDAETSRFSAAFTEAARQLGDASPAVRIAGVYALAALADRYRDRRQQCIDILCGYLRLPYNPAAGAGHLAEHSIEIIDEGDRTKTVDRHAYRADDREVRFTIIRVMRDHLRTEAAVKWQGYDFDFTGATFDGADFSGAVVSSGYVSFRRARFSGGAVHFGGAEFSGGTVNFHGAEFSGGTVNFGGAEFSGGDVRFHNAKFAGGSVYFHGAEFSGGTVRFVGAEFSGGEVSFINAKFAGGEVYYDFAQFSGGTVAFGGADFSGGEASFNGAEFSGGGVSFLNARFAGGWVHFDDAEFSGGTVYFDGAYEGTITFTNSFWGGATVYVSGELVSSAEEAERALCHPSPEGAAYEEKVPD